jgi:3',5'-cyclic AMP phosphodiesterase CpdA
LLIIIKKRFLYRILSIFGCLLISQMFVSADTLHTETVWPETTFFVTSDLHYLSPALFDPESKSFIKFMGTNDNKLLEESAELVEVFLQAAVKEQPDFILITGDLTTNGEKVNHTELADLFRKTEAAGVQVYVLPGNHDIMNPYAASFMGDKHKLIDSVYPKDFADIYNNFGYLESVYRDPNSLSYVVEPVDGLWLVCIDSNSYSDNFNNGYPWPYGSVQTYLYHWLEEVLDSAKSQGKKVIAAIHHPVINPVGSGTQTFGSQTVASSDNVVDFLIRHNVPAIFSGHTHAQNITVKEWVNGNLYDIGTGALPVFPHIYRIAEITHDQKLVLDWSEITSLPSYRERGEEFYKMSWEFAVYGRIEGTQKNLVKSQQFSDEEAYAMAEYLGMLGVRCMGGFDDDLGNLAKHAGAKLWDQVRNGNMARYVTLMSNDPGPSDNIAVIVLE